MVVEDDEAGLLMRGGSGTGGSAEAFAEASASLNSPVDSPSFEDCDEPGSGLSILAINAPPTTQRCCFCVTREWAKPRTKRVSSGVDSSRHAN